MSNPKEKVVKRAELEAQLLHLWALRRVLGESISQVIPEAGDIGLPQEKRALRFSSSWENVRRRTAQRIESLVVALGEMSLDSDVVTVLEGSFPRVSSEADDYSVEGALSHLPPPARGRLALVIDTGVPETGYEIWGYDSADRIWKLKKRARSLRGVTDF
jgi:hypothetical protein